MRLPAILVVLVLAAGLAAAEERPTSLVLVTLDTTRADHVVGELKPPFFLWVHYFDPP